MKGKKYSAQLKLDPVNAEAFYELKRNIHFLCSDNKKVIGITSSDRGEGRSTTAAYLALSLAEGGKRTILVDCDQKNPNIHNMFNVYNECGLLNYLCDEAKFGDIVQPTRDDDLSVVTAGRCTANYAELIDSIKFMNFIKLLKESFDYIIIDTPALSDGADAQGILKYTDGCVLVVEAGKTERKVAKKAKELLEKINVNIIGVFLNKLNS